MINLLKSIHWVKSSAQGSCFHKLRADVSSGYLGKVWWEQSFFHKLKTMQTLFTKWMAFSWKFASCIWISNFKQPFADSIGHFEFRTEFSCVHMTKNESMSQNKLLFHKIFSKQTFCTWMKLIWALALSEKNPVYLFWRSRILTNHKTVD